MRAQDFRTAVPRPDDRKTIETCLDKGKDAAGRRLCVGRVSKPCEDASEGQSTMGIEQCLSREYVVWDAVLNRTFRSAERAFGASGKIYLRDVQTTWIKYRDQSCQWPSQVYPGGTIAGPITGECLVDETATRAITLMDIDESLSQH